MDFDLFFEVLFPVSVFGSGLSIMIKANAKIIIARVAAAIFPFSLKELVNDEIIVLRSESSIFNLERNIS